MPILSGFPTGGAGELNFSVVAYASELLLPTTASENTIAVITSTQITSYTFAVDEPSAPANGMVWFCTNDGNNIRFDATSDNPIVVYPEYAQQYVSGSWVNVDASIFQNNEWIALSVKGLLYSAGKQYVPFEAKGKTGGWAATAPIFGDESITLQKSSSTSGTGISGVVTTNAIDITEFTELHVVFESASGLSGDCVLIVQISTTKTSSWDHEKSIAYKDCTTASSWQPEVVVPFSASGSYYIDIFTMRAATAVISKVWLT